MVFGARLLQKPAMLVTSREREVDSSIVMDVAQAGVFLSLFIQFCFSLCHSSGGSRIFQMGGRCFVTNGGAHILFSGKKCMKLKEIGLKWGGARLLAPCYSKITIFL